MSQNVTNIPDIRLIFLTHPSSLFGDDTLEGSMYLACFVIQIMDNIVAGG